METNFTFNPKNHTYELDGKKMTGVTTVLGVIAKPALIQWAADMACNWLKENCSPDPHWGDGKWYQVSDEHLEEARKAHARKKEDAGAKGTDVHAQVEELIKFWIAENEGWAMGIGRNDYSKMVQPFIDWSITNNVRFLESEKKVYSREWWVAGTADFTCEIDGKRYVGDLKTMKKVWDRTPFFQTAAYRKMLQEMGEPPYDGTIIVNINKETNELSEHRSYRTEADESCFEAALALYRNLEIT